jgi:hypothetical protein
MVRQLFEAGVLQSGFWHQFAMTHSPVGCIQKICKRNMLYFANNDINYTDKTGIDHDKFLWTQEIVI